MKAIVNYIGRIFTSFGRKKGEDSFLTSMHWINRISILMFLVALVILTLKLRK